MNAEKSKKRFRIIPRGGTKGVGISIRSTFLFLLAAAMILSSVLPANGAVEMTDDGKVRFTYYDPYAGKVFLAGSFNNWSTTTNPMNKDTGGCRWTWTRGSMNTSSWWTGPGLLTRKIPIPRQTPTGG